MAPDLSLLRAADEAGETKAAIIDGVAYTFADLAPRVRSAVTWLRAKLAGAQAPRVAIVPTADLETLVLLYALLETGTTVVMVHPRLVASERDALLADAQPTLTILDTSSVPRTADPDRAFVVTPSPDPSACLAILYTSGTSGRSKGALLSRRAFLASAQGSATNMGWRADDRWMLCMPLAHVGGLSIVTRCLLARRTVVLVTGRFDPENIVRRISEDRATIVSFVPTMLARVFETMPSWTPPRHLRALLLGGAGASPKLLDEARRRGAPSLTTYGLTEACSQVTAQAIGTAPGVEHGAGAPIPGVAIRIEDGEIQVRGDTMMSGYFPVGAHDSPFTEDGWLRTGDLGRLDDEGRLHLEARRSDLIVTGGENVYPVEVERALESLPGVVASCVFGQPDPLWGAVVCAAIVPEDRTHPPTLEAVREHVSSRLAVYKRPRMIAVVAALVTADSGKLDRRATAVAATPHLMAVAKDARGLL